jgi:hypothetical protein
MLDREDAEEKKARRLAREKTELDDVHKDLVKCVLSNTRIDPKYEGKEIEFFKAKHFQKLTRAENWEFSIVASS